MKGRQEQVTPDLSPIERMIERLDSTAVFGQPTRQGDVTIIPVAEIAFGFGYGSNPKAEHATGAAGGSGAGGRATPRGYIQITPRNVTFKATPNSNILGLAGILMVAWNVFWVTRTVRAFTNRGRD